MFQRHSLCRMLPWAVRGQGRSCHEDIGALHTAQATKARSELCRTTCVVWPTAVEGATKGQHGCVPATTPQATQGMKADSATPWVQLNPAGLSAEGTLGGIGVSWHVRQSDVGLPSASCSANHQPQHTPKHFSGAPAPGFDVRKPVLLVQVAVAIEPPGPHVFVGHGRHDSMVGCEALGKKSPR